MLPDWIFSRWLTQRMKVVLPEPDGPHTTTTSCCLTVIETPLRTSLWPKNLWMSVTSTTFVTSAVGAPPIASRSSCRPWKPGRPPADAGAVADGGVGTGDRASAAHEPMQSRSPNRRAESPVEGGGAPGVPRARRRSIQAWMKPQIVVSSRYQTAAARNSSNGAEVLTLLDVEDRVQLDHADHEQQRGRLEHVVELVAEGRNDHPGRLRQDDPAHRLARGHAQGSGRLHLARIDREDAGADDLGHVGALVQAEGKDPGLDGSLRSLSGRTPSPASRTAWPPQGRR